MDEAGIDMWLVLNREYADDPVYFTLVPQPSFAARRTTMLVFHRLDDGTVDRLTVNRYPLGGPYEPAWEGGSLEQQWTALAALPENFHPRLGSAENLAIRWLETRSERELAVYPHVVSIARGVIAEAFSPRAITPGVTTTDEVAWFIRQRFEEMGLAIWFMPYVNIQRRGLECSEDAPFCGTFGTILPGDVLHTDVGICYLKLCTDTQEMADVLELGESEAPRGLVRALEQGNDWQDRLAAEFVTGRTANEILAAAQQAMADAPWSFNIYTHRSATLATLLGRPSACGTCRPQLPTPATGRCTPTPPTPSRAASRPPCRSGAVSWSTSSWSSRRCSTANA